MERVYEFDPAAPRMVFERHPEAVAFLLDCGYLRGPAQDFYTNAEGDWAFIKGCAEDGWAVSYP